MLQCFLDLAEAIEAIGTQQAEQFSTGMNLVRSSHDVYWEFAQDLGPYEVLLLSHLLPREVSFAHFGFTALERERAQANLRGTITEVLTAVFRQDLGPQGHLESASTESFRR
jgi:hypothetical protein